MQGVLLGLVAVAVIAGLIALNVWHYRHKMSMTKEEWKAEEDEIKREVTGW
jgi:flagellar biosynthesis protein FlhB